MMEKRYADQSQGEEAPAGSERPAATEIGGGREEREVPPDDDVCPICFSDFTVPCRSVCGHWYCGGLILIRSSF